MREPMSATRSRTRPAARLIVAATMFATAAVMGVSACAKSTASTSPDRKAMMESVAKWYVAEGAADLEGVRAGVYDPTNLLGLATATPPPADVQTTTVIWKWEGDKILLAAPNNPQETTVTIVASSTPDVVLIADELGQGGALIMKKVDGAWRIDVVETKKAAEAAAPPGEPTLPTETP
jgi:hypothetical protein